MVGSDDETDFHSQLEYQYRNLYAGFHSVVSRQDVANQSVGAMWQYDHEQL